jgi:hypothetical protein
MLLLSLDRVDGLFLPTKIESGLGSVGGHEHRDLMLYLSLLFLISTSSY